MNFSRPEIGVRGRYTASLRRAATLVLVCTLNLGISLGADVSVVRGEVLIDSAGIHRVTECGTKRELRIDPMTTSQYAFFSRQYETLSEERKFKVWVEIRGTITQRVTDEVRGELVISSGIWTLMRASCDIGSASTP